MKEKAYFFRAMDALSAALIMLFAFECTVGCSGRWLTIGGISIRIVLFAVCFLTTLPNVFSSLKRTICNPYVLFAGVFGIYLIVSAFIGTQKGNALQFVRADISGFLALALLPGFLATIRTGERVEKVMRVIFFGALAMAAVTVFFHFLFAHLSNERIFEINQWLNAHSMGGFARLSSGLQRIYLRSQIFLQVALLFGIVEIGKSRGAASVWLLLGEGMIAFACLISYTRGFWLGFAAGAFAMLLMVPERWKAYLIILGGTLVVVASCFLLSWLDYGQPKAAQEFVFRFDSRFMVDISEGNFPTDPSSPITDPNSPITDPSSPITDAAAAAVTLRSNTIRGLEKRIRMHPVLGNGLGANLDGLRTDGKTEYMYLDMLMKLGTVGFILFMVVYFLPAGQIILRRLVGIRRKERLQWTDKQMRDIALAAAFLSVAVTSWYNPFLTNPMGILLLLLNASAVYCPPADCKKEISV